MMNITIFYNNRNDNINMTTTNDSNYYNSDNYNNHGNNSYY